jgi:hypothetical protein
VQIADRVWVAANQERLAWLTYVRGRWERVARLFGAAADLHERISAPLSPTETAADGEIIATVRTRLEELAFVAAWQVGSAWPSSRPCMKRLTSEQCAASRTSTACGSVSPCPGGLVPSDRLSQLRHDPARAAVARREERLRSGDGAHVRRAVDRFTVDKKGTRLDCPPPNCDKFP